MHHLFASSTAHSYVSTEQEGESNVAVLFGGWGDVGVEVAPNSDYLRSVVWCQHVTKPRSLVLPLSTRLLFSNVDWSPSNGI
mmetsp:Transcript_25328/g.63538  ORF Transcript_25328/g.63538 Transcript_25328/m.63538 type:complete len:82 (-) Transcript_25328:524-769(-)